MAKIFESPDRGDTVYSRESGETYRTLVKENQHLFKKMAEDKLWGEIRRAAQTNPKLNKILEQAKVFYHLSKDGNSKT